MLSNLVALTLSLCLSISLVAANLSVIETANVIATSCSTSIALIHTTLDTVMSIALENPSNATLYIPSISKDLALITQGLDQSGQNLKGSAQIKDAGLAAKSSQWTDSLSQTYISTLKRVPKLVVSNNAKPWKELVTSVERAHRSTQNFYATVAKINPPDAGIRDQQYNLDVAFHHAVRSLWGSG